MCAPAKAKEAAEFAAKWWADTVFRSKDYNRGYEDVSENSFYDYMDNKRKEALITVSEEKIVAFEEALKKIILEQLSVIPYDICIRVGYHPDTTLMSAVREAGIECEEMQLNYPLMTATYVRPGYVSVLANKKEKVLWAAPSFKL